MWLPTNFDTQTILYDTGFLKSSKGRYPPLKWKVSKIEDTASLGISRFTLTQAQFDPNTDNVEDMIADYYYSAVKPDESCLDDNYVDQFKISYSGYPAVRAGGGYKKFSLVSNDKSQIIPENLVWKIDFGEYNEKLEYKTLENSIKIKCTDDYSLIGKVFRLFAEYMNSEFYLDVEVSSL